MTAPVRVITSSLEYRLSRWWRRVLADLKVSSVFLVRMSRRAKPDDLELALDERARHVDTTERDARGRGDDRFDDVAIEASGPSLLPDDRGKLLSRPGGPVWLRLG
jgi:hypothetical protein